VNPIVHLTPRPLAWVYRRLVQRGGRTAILPAPGTGFGNHLYYWQQAHARQNKGMDCRVVHAPGMDPWLAQLPGVSEQLMVTRDALRLTDRRDGSSFQRFGIDFTRDELRAFARDHLVASPLIGDPVAVPGIVTVNVRRGDYYSNPEYRGLYGFDIASYTEVAAERAASAGEIERFVVVSDGIDWCRLKLDAILRRHAGQVEYVVGRSAQEQFRSVATSMRVIGTNSTFSYWAAYVSNMLFGSSAHVIMPDFHRRMKNDGRAYQHDPEWDIVRDIPGGWDA
jgi:hypothetical protein